jgi:DNA (cytosine-5)-methyltransferase 1
VAELKYVDLFSGCGGLSLGLERAGLELVVAVEKSSMPAQTFYHNFVDSSLSDEDWVEYLDRDIEYQLKHKVIPRTVGEVISNDSIMASIREQGVDVVCGGPPCQGFSTAGRRDHSDPRNQLAWQFLEFVEKTDPKIVVIENVLGMNRAFPGMSETPFKMYSDALAVTGSGYTVQKVIVNAMHYGAPQSRPRVLIIGVRKDIASDHNISVDSGIWKSDFVDNLGDVESLSAVIPLPVLTQEQVRTVADAIVDLQTHQNFKATDSDNSNSFLEFVKDTDAWSLESHSELQNVDLPKHSESTLKRLRLKQALASQGLNKDILYKFSIGEDISALIGYASFPMSSPDGLLAIKDSTELMNVLNDVRSRKRSQMVLDPDKPSKTVLTLPEDYIHPYEPRIFTVREMARFQAFADDFVFRGRISTGGAMRKFTVPQYSQVGNAVSPALSFAIGKMITHVL